MSLVSQINSLALRIGQEIANLRDQVGQGGAQQVFVQPDAPYVKPGVAFIWFQTGLGDSGEDMTLWIEDGQ